MTSLPFADEVLECAAIAVAALEPVVDRDWSVLAGSLEWDVRRTVGHLAGGPAKHTIYLASRCDHFVAVSTGGWPDATPEELVASIVPVIEGLVRVAAGTPPELAVFHGSGPRTPSEYLVMDCVELLVHTEDVLDGLGVPFTPPEGLCARVLAAAYPDRPPEPSAWHALVTANGRTPRP